MSEVPKAPSESAGEGVAKWCPGLADRVVHTATTDIRNRLGAGVADRHRLNGLIGRSDVVECVLTTVPRCCVNSNASALGEIDT